MVDLKTKTTRKWTLLRWVCTSCANTCVATLEHPPLTCQPECPQPDYVPMRLQRATHAGQSDWIFKR